MSQKTPVEKLLAASTWCFMSPLATCGTDVVRRSLIDYIWYSLSLATSNMDTFLASYYHQDCSHYKITTLYPILINSGAQQKINVHVTKVCDWKMGWGELLIAASAEELQLFSNVFYHT